MNRRDFIKGATAATAMLALGTHETLASESMGDWERLAIWLHERDANRERMSIPTDATYVHVSELVSYDTRIDALLEGSGWTHRIRSHDDFVHLALVKEAEGSATVYRADVYARWWVGHTALTPLRDEVRQGAYEAVIVKAQEELPFIIESANLLTDATRYWEYMAEVMPEGEWHQRETSTGARWLAMPQQGEYVMHGLWVYEGRTA